ncbi:MAG: Ku protein, partial [Tistlia sp.]
TQEEIDDIKIEARKTLDLVQFVDNCEIDPIYFDRPYYVAPDDDLAEDAFRVLRDALRQTKKVGLGQLVMRGREYIGALKPCSRGLILETLHFADELRKSDPYFAEISDVKPDKELLALAQELIERKSKPFKAEVFQDSYSEALRELVQKKAKGRKATVAVDEGEAPTGEVVDLMAALKQSLGKGGKSSGGAAAKRRPRSKKAA